MAELEEVVVEAQEVPEVPKEEEQKEAVKPKFQELPTESPEEITLPRPAGPVTFTKKRPVGRPKKEPKAKAKAKAKKVVVKETVPAPEREPPEPPELPSEPPPLQPLVRLSGKEKLEEHMKIMQELRVSAKESQRLKYRAMLRA